VWTPEPIVTPKVATLPAPAAEVVAPQIPDWDRSAVSASGSSPDAGSELAGETAPPHRPVPAHGVPRRRNRATTAVIVLASLVTFFLAVTAVMILLHHSANATAGTAPTGTVASSDSTQLLAATRVADGATATTGSELHSLKGIPTTVAVAAVVNPYVATLGQYEDTLSGPGVPAAARTAVADARALVGQDVQFLSTINGLEPIRLGSYLEQFGKNAAQFQLALGTLEHDLGASTT
jgi:hypothetical protein